MGYVHVGGGIGAAVLADGRLNVVAGPLFAQIERERADGPRYVEALVQSRMSREFSAAGWVAEGDFHVKRNKPVPGLYDDRPSADELSGGIPVGWITR